MQVKIDDTLTKMVNDDKTEALKEELSDAKNKIYEILFKADGTKRTEIKRNWDAVRTSTIIINKSINERKNKDGDENTELQEIIYAKDFSSAEKNATRIPRKQKDNKFTNFFRNFKYFYKEINELSESQLNLFAKTFLNECEIIEIKTTQLEQAITMFNSLNSTGQPLTTTDIVSAQLYSNSNDKRQEFGEKWKALMSATDNLLAINMNIDNVLQQFMYINRAQEKEYTSITEDGKQSINVTTPGLRSY